MIVRIDQGVRSIPCNIRHVILAAFTIMFGIVSIVITKNKIKLGDSLDPVHKVDNKGLTTLRFTVANLSSTRDVWNFVTMNYTRQLNHFRLDVQGTKAKLDHKLQLRAAVDGIATHALHLDRLDIFASGELFSFHITFFARGSGLIEELGDFIINRVLRVEDWRYIIIHKTDLQ